MKKVIFLFVVTRLGVMCANTTNKKITFFINFFGKRNLGSHTFMAYLVNNAFAASGYENHFCRAHGKIIAASTALSEHLQTSR
jgi:hypothetical protein